MDVSIIIPARNEQNSIGITLDALKKAEQYLDSEIIVVDAGSTDRTAEIAVDRGATVLSHSPLPPGTARNRGVAEASGELYAFLDADMAITDGWCQEVAKLVADKERTLGITGARHSIRDDATWVENNWCGALCAHQPRFVPAGNLICDSEVFETLGGFDESMVTGEDVNLCERAGAAGYRVKTDESLQVVHFRNPRTLCQFWVREAWHGAGDGGSVRNVLHSKVAMMAVAFALCLLVAMGGAVTERWIVCMGGLVAAFGLAAICSAKLFAAAGPRMMLFNIPLCGVYLSARFAALIIPTGFISRVKLVQKSQTQAGG